MLLVTAIESGDTFQKNLLREYEGYDPLIFSLRLKRGSQNMQRIHCCRLH